MYRYQSEVMISKKENDRYINKGPVAENEATTLTPDQSKTIDQPNLRVVVSPKILQVHLGEIYELICTVYGGDTSTLVYWIQEEPERRYVSTGTTLKHVSAS
ncbi:hypothetical protein I4U23_023162 [Adineta vaga]|nr:hypothetical protein I4U23_023162 [Adineta vaga]